MLKSTILIFQSDEFLLISSQNINLILKMSDDDVPLIGLNLKGRVEIRGSLGGRHLILKVIN